MKVDQIPGLAVAVIRNKKTIFEKYHGLANIEHSVPVSEKTLFRVYSTTKLITAVAIFQLIEAGKLTLNDSLDLHLDDVPTGWQGIKVKHLLTHCSGLPEYKVYDQSLSDAVILDTISKKKLHFDPGNRYQYNQTNFWFLKKIIEKKSGENFSEFIKNGQFSKHQQNIIFASNSLVAFKNRVAKYQFNKIENAYELSTYAAGPRSLAGNGLNANLQSLIAWNRDLDSRKLLNRKSMDKMYSVFHYKDDAQLFGYSWGIFGPKGKRYHGFAGGGVCGIMKFLDHDLTIIILSNGFKNRPVISNAVNYISGLCDPRLIRKDRVKREESRLSIDRSALGKKK